MGQKNHTPSAIICLDLDGTSVESDTIHAWFSEAVAQEINAATALGAMWCTNSGRRAHNQQGIIQACRTLTALPFAIMSGERYIHDVHSADGALRPRQPYNNQAKQEAQKLSRRAKEVLAPHLERLVADFAVAEYFPSSEFVGWLLSRSADPVAFAARVAGLIASESGMQVLRNGAWVIVTCAAFGKGRVLADATLELAVPRERILTVGDQHNDIDMLDGRCAGFVGCPADADAEVRAVVERAGGWIADHPGPTGTAQLIRRFVTEVLG
ncbi:MAG: hypothetical protein KAV82_07815 [Phycisphaerae bacterium]|nr:hypothetical protein [Phycisphaerae bacterium]